MSKSLYDYCIENNRPELLAQWHTKQNGNLTPKDVFAGGKTKLWWICEIGHEYRATANDRTTGKTSCPICAGKKVLTGFNDLATKNPEIAAQWHPEKNGDLTPEKATTFSNKKVWWQCALGHEYQAWVADRAKGKGCPYCAGKRVLAGFNDLATKEPMLAIQWHQELNGDLTPEMGTPGSNKKVWWKCPVGHVWQAYIYSRTRTTGKTGCPVCAGVVNSKKTTRYTVLVEEDK